MKMYLISDNVDTYTGMRLAGVDGVVVHEKQELRDALETAMNDKSIGIILLTERFGREFPDLIDEIKLKRKMPLLIALKEPLTNKIKKKTEKMEQSKAMFVTQAFFELFETLLSYFSNTLSFIRIGAFAVSHASIMEVVLMLAGAESGHINWVVIVLGNLFVCGFEGLIVGIQVLRLVYYEMFSRFYKGSGREFKPYTGTAKN